VEKRKGEHMPAMDFILPNLVHVGAILYLICFLFRDQILLRTFAILGDFAYVAYYFNVADQPLWWAIFWNIPNVGVNLFMIAMILRDRGTGNFTENDLKLYGKLPSIDPRNFRKLLKAGNWVTAHADTVLTREGERPDHIYFVLEGDIDLRKGGRKIDVQPGLFIGEIAFVTEQVATATATVSKNALYYAWPRGALQIARDKDHELAAAIGAILNVDLAGKLARM
jgi:Cyclic nucleotide-binding domain